MFTKFCANRRCIFKRSGILTYDFIDAVEQNFRTENDTMGIPSISYAPDHFVLSISNVNVKKIGLELKCSSR